MRLRRTLPVLALSLAMALTGCGGDEEPKGGATSSSATESPAVPWDDAEPAVGREMSGTGYTFKAPKGWIDATENAKAVNQLVEVAASDEPDETGFATNVNVVVSDAGMEEPDEDQLKDVSDAIQKELVKLAPKLRVNEPTELEGQPTLDHEGAAVREDIRYYIHQYVAFKNRKAYTITFSFSRAKTGKERAAVINPVLASWSWK